MQPDWQTELADSFTGLPELLSWLDLSLAECPEIREAAAGFPLRVTRAYASRIRKGDPTDPLLRQILPLAAEWQDTPGFDGDPVGDLNAVTQSGLLHKYTGRVLLITTGACAIHCRYCFRRDFPYQDQQLSKSREEAALASIARDERIEEVILSGGDPLVLSDERLLGLIQRISEIPHVRRLRLHSRIPVVLPSRIHAGLMDRLAMLRQRVVMVIHANHPNELDKHVCEALLALTQRGVTVLNQAVLLKGVNDDAESLRQLSLKLFDCGVLPYYLHALDRARGTAHFEVSDAQALTLMEVLRGQLPGYLVPRLVREVAGAKSKLPLVE